MVRANPERFFVPPYVGPSGWIGVHLDGDIDWRSSTCCCVIRIDSRRRSVSPPGVEDP